MSRAAFQTSAELFGAAASAARAVLETYTAAREGGGLLAGAVAALADYEALVLATSDDLRDFVLLEVLRDEVGRLHRAEQPPAGDVSPQPPVAAEMQTPVPVASSAPLVGEQLRDGVAQKLGELRAVLLQHRAMREELIAATRELLNLRRGIELARAGRSVLLSAIERRESTHLQTAAPN